MGQALAVLEDALAGRGRLLLLAGEPGIGKSRLADELAAHAKQRGVRVVWGRCWEAGGAPAYWPWVQSMRSLIRNLDAEQLRAAMASGASDIAQLLPEIHATIGELPVPQSSDPDAARFRLFDSAMTFLRNRATEQPLMLVLDDLQVADIPSLLLLRFVAGALGDERMVILGTYRDTEVTPDDPLATSLTELAREKAVCTLTMKGLTETDVSRFIETTSGIAPQESVARTVHDETDGNPLFLGEVVRLLVAEGRLERVGESGPRLTMPQNVREVIRRRLRQLSHECVHLLTLASVLGREFNLDALSRLAERPIDDVLELLDESLVARVVTDVPGSRDRLRFSHVVIRECLYDEMGMARRIQCHRRAAQVLEVLYRNDSEPHLAELAHHFFEGAQGGDVEKAIGYARKAGEKAITLLAYEEAVRLQRMALEAMALSQTTEPTERCDTLLALGDAQARAGDEAGSQQTFLRAAELGRSLRPNAHLARAALGYGGRLVWVRAGADPHLIPLLRDGLAAVGERDSVLRARIMARLSGALRDDPCREPRESLAGQAVDMARRLKDPATLAYTLDGLFAALWRPDNPCERLPIATELVTVGESVNDRERTAAGHLYRFFAYLELEDTASAYRELGVIDQVTDELRQPVHTWWAVSARGLLALLEGRFDDAEPLIAAAFRLGVRAHRSDALSAHALHSFQLRREQGRLAEMEDVIWRSAQEFTWYPMFRCALANLYCELGREAEARVEFEQIAADDFAGLPFDNEWLFGMSLVSEVAHVLGDGRRAETLYRQLLPYAKRNAFGAFEGCVGSVSRYLGRLAAAMSRGDDAVRHFQESLERNTQMGARPWVAHTQHDLAVTLIKRDNPGDAERADELLDAALRTCEELGMPALQAKVVAASASLGGAAPAASIGIRATGQEEPAQGKDPRPLAADSNRRPAQAGTLRLEGEYWSIGYDGRVLRLRDSKGLRVLARLLAEPGRPHACLDLERLGATGDAATARAVAASDAGVLLDDEARRAYRARLAELREAIEDAEPWSNPDQVGAMREEMDFITHELGRSLGLGGRSRRAGSVAERSRLNVTRAVRSSLRRIAIADDGLASHLEATVHTGTVCVYSPDPRSPMDWHVSPGNVHSG